MADEKSMVFKFVVDEPSAQKMLRIIADLTNHAQALQKALSGTGGQGGVSSILTGGVGSAPTQGTMVSRAQGGGNATKTITQVFEANAQGLKGLASSSQNSLRIMTDGVKKAMEESSRSVMGFDRALEKLFQRYSNFSSSQGIFGRARAEAEASAARPPPLPLGTKGLRSLQSVLQLPDERGDWFDKIQARHNASSVSASLADIAPIGGAAPGGGGGGSGLALALRQAFPSLGRFAGPAAGAAAIGAGVAAVGQTAWGRYWDHPMAEGRQQAALAGTWSDPLLSTMYGHKGFSDASRRIQNDSGWREGLENISGQNFGARWEAFHPSLNFSAMWDAQSDRNIAQIKGQRQVEYVNNVNSGDTKQKEFNDWQAATAEQRLQQMHQLGIGGSLVKNKAGVTREALDHFLQPFRNAGFGEGEGIGATLGIEGGSTRLAGRSLGLTSLYAGVGGIHSANEILAQMSGGGLGAATGFMSALQGSTGDPSALNTVGSAIARIVASGGTGSSGLGLLEQMGAGLTGGFGDQITARQNVAGFENFDKTLVQGGASGYQQARNTQLAFGAFGGKGSVAAQYAAVQMTGAEVADLRRGRLSPNLKNLGYTASDIPALLQLNSDKISSHMDSMVDGGGNGPLNESMRKMRARGMDPVSYAQSLSGQEREDFVSQWGTALQTSGQAPDYATAQGQARMELGLDVGGGRKGKGRGKGMDYGPEGEAAKVKAELDDEHAKHLAEENEVIKAQIQTTKVLTEAFLRLQRGADDSAASLSALAETQAALRAGKVRPEDVMDYYHKLKVQRNVAEAKKHKDPVWKERDHR